MYPGSVWVVALAVMLCDGYDVLVVMERMGDKDGC
jgi:hypothetical protein